MLKYDELQQPVCKCTIECHISYLSPQGRNHRSTFKTYDDECITKAIKKYEINQAQYTNPIDLSKYGPQYERSLMTDDLRYRVLKRDGFRCQICGHGQADGVKLHVDHILPVSKGGRTIMSNLRTLCSSCNLGKRDKYDESGLN
ncbi:MAG: HNH endonuclease [Acetatifactor sp.]|nr:HNH endonuclease [Acetatifactor sp.]